MAFGTATAAPVTGGETVIDIDLPDGADGLFSGPFREAFQRDEDLIILNITGGDVDFDAGTGQIEHQNSGFFVTDDRGRFVGVNDLVIDVAQQGVFGTVIIDDRGQREVRDDVRVLNFDLSSLMDPSQLTNLSDPELDLFATGAFSDILNGVFAELGDVTGIQFGEVATNPDLDGTGGGMDPDVIPLPGAAVLFGTVAFAGAARRKFGRAA